MNAFFVLRPLTHGLIRIAVLFILLLLFHAVAAAQTWQSCDIGPVGVAGSSTDDHAIITLRGSGADIWGAADGGHFLSLPQSGNQTLVVRVTDAGGGNAWAKVGLMMREDLTAGAKEVMAYATPGNHVGLQSRATAGGTTTTTADAWGTVPIWLMLDRAGDVFRAYRSTDGDTWTKIGEVTVAMAASIRIGLAVTSHNNAVLQVATVDHFMQLGDQPPSAPTRLRTGWSSGSSLGLAWDPTTIEATAFEVERAPGTAGEFVRVATTAVGTADYVDSGLAPRTAYRYRVRAIADGQASAYSPEIKAWTTEDTTSLPAPSDLRVGQVTAGSVQLLWTDNSSDETGFEYWRRVQGTGEFGLQGGMAANSTSHTDSNFLTANTTYEYRVRAVRNGTYSSFVSVTATTASPPTGSWAGGDLGAVGPAGSSSVSSDGSTYTVRAGGGDIWGGADAFRMQYQQWNGDGMMAARITSLTNTDPWAKAGVMVRSTFDSTSANAAMVVTAGGGCGFQARATAGGATTYTAGPRVNLPYWVGVTRAGNVFKGFISPDGVNWTQVGSAEIAMGGNVFIGMAASAHSSSGALTTAMFDTISTPTTTTPPPPPPSAAWSQQTWGGTTGSATPSGADVALSAKGGDIWGTGDSGMSAYRTWTGDVTVMARLGSFNPVNEWTKAGVVIRASGAANAANAFVAFTGSHGNMLQTRTTAGAATTSPQQNPSPNGAGEWLKLVRTGDAFTGYHSRDDRATWVSLGSVTIIMPAEVQVGVALAAHDPAASATATFDSVSIE